MHADNLMLLKEEIASCQTVLTELGYYKGKIDGIWGPASAAAKIEFEHSGKFKPGIPNKGLPFQRNPPFPSGISKVSGLLKLRDDLKKVPEVVAKVTAPTERVVRTTQPPTTTTQPESI